MLKIGITGNIGGGKTTVSKIFEVLDVPVFYADDAAKKVMVNDPMLISCDKNDIWEEAYFDEDTKPKTYRRYCF